MPRGLTNRKYQVRNRQLGLSLIELLVVVGIMGVIGSISVSQYTEYTYTAQMNRAISEIRSADVLIQDYFRFHRSYPFSLGTVGVTYKDPWGNDYRYLDIAGGGKKTRKDKNLTPINSDYDLYSMGQDGKTTLPLTAKASKDDIVRANNGRFIGKAIDY